MKYAENEILSSNEVSVDSESMSQRTIYDIKNP